VGAELRLARGVCGSARRASGGELAVIDLAVESGDPTPACAGPSCGASATSSTDSSSPSSTRCWPPRQSGGRPIIASPCSSTRWRSSWSGPDRTRPPSAEQVGLRAEQVGLRAEQVPPSRHRCTFWRRGTFSAPRGPSRRRGDLLGAGPRGLRAAATAHDRKAEVTR
jgi:hypothetical protein